MRIDLNADVGEGFDDAPLLPLITSASIACGGHAGDDDTMRTTSQSARAKGVTIGAHVSYPDRPGFGRSFLDIGPSELAATVTAQFRALEAHASSAGAILAYCKPHGGLYNAIIHHEAQAEAVAEALSQVRPGLPILCLPNSAIERAATRHGLRPVREAFADRAYTASGTLVPRTEPGAVLHDAGEIAARVLRMVSDGVVQSADGTTVALAPESVCVHGDTPGAVEIARAVRDALAAARVELASFA